MSEKILLLICMSLTVSVISLTVTKAAVFSWLRVWIKNRNSFFGELFSCPFCFSYYVSATVMFFGGISIFPGMLWFGWVLTYFSIIGIAAVISGIIFYLFSLME